MNNIKKYFTSHFLFEAVWCVADIFVSHMRRNIFTENLHHFTVVSVFSVCRCDNVAPQGHLPDKGPNNTRDHIRSPFLYASAYVCVWVCQAIFATLKIRIYDTAQSREHRPNASALKCSLSRYLWCFEW